MRTTPLTEMFRDITENDVYDFSMMAANLALYPDALVEYQIVDRSGADYPNYFADIIMEKLQDAPRIKNDLKLNRFLSEYFPYPPAEFFPWLSNLRLNSDYVKIQLTPQNRLTGSIIGPWVETTPFEQIIMGTSTQTYNELRGFLPDKNWEEKLIPRIKNLRQNGAIVSEFGLRRRAYHWMQDRVNELLVTYGGLFGLGGIFAGSSSPFHCYPYNISPKGTVAHQEYEFHAAKFGIENANLATIMAWRAVYGDELGTALPDTFTSDYFWMTLPPILARMIKSYRQDSGDPFLWTDHVYRYFKHFDLPTSETTLMYTDSLDDVKAIEILNYVRKSNYGFKVAFGMGGFFTNNKLFFENTPAYKPLQLVVKLVKVSLDGGKTWIPTAKVPDVASKAVGDTITIAKFQKAIAKLPFDY